MKILSTKQYSKRIGESVIPRNAKTIKASHRGNSYTLEKSPSGWRVSDSTKGDDVGVLIDTSYLRTWDNIEVIDTDPEYKPRRTKEVKVLQGYYDLGWEDLVTYSAPYDYKEIKDDLKSYRENEGRAFRVITRRVPIDESTKNKVTEADNEKTFEVEYTVTYKKNLKGASASDVRNQIKVDDPGNQVYIRYVKEVAPISEEKISESAGENNVFSHKYEYGTEPYDITVAVNSIGSTVKDYSNKKHWKVIKDALAKYIQQNYKESKEDENKITEDFGDEFLGEPENIGLDELDIDTPKKEFAPDDDITPAPEGDSAAMVGLLNSLVIDELDAVNSYNGAVETIRTMPPDMPGANAAISVLSDISDEENSHIGEIQELLKQFTPQANAVEDGKNEARGIINNTPPSATPSAPVTANDYALELASDNFVVDDDISF